VVHKSLTETKMLESKIRSKQKVDEEEVVHNSFNLSKTVLMNKTLYIIFSLKHKGQYFQEQNLFFFTFF
jgi:hypothetical protein